MYKKIKVFAAIFLSVFVLGLVKPALASPSVLNIQKIGFSEDSSQMEQEMRQNMKQMQADLNQQSAEFQKEAQKPTNSYTINQNYEKPFTVAGWFLSLGIGLILIIIFIGIFCFIFTLWMFIDAVQFAPESERVMWIVLMVVLFFLGGSSFIVALIYYFLRYRPRKAEEKKTAVSSPATPFAIS